MGLNDGEDEPEDEEDDSEEVDDGEKDEAWAPHGTKTMFLLDMLDNFPRLRLSDDQLKAILWVMREAGTPAVPSFKSLRNLQARLTHEVGIDSEEHVSALGNRFFANQPHTLFKLDWANPLVRQHIHPYPDFSSTISKSWQAAKWVSEISNEDLSPMWADWEAASHRHYFVGELARMCNRQFVIPIRWVTFAGVDHLQGYTVIYDPTGKMFQVQDGLIHIPATNLMLNYRDLLAKYGKITFASVFRPTLLPDTPAWVNMMPNPLHELAHGRPMFTIRSLVWGDDVSGNRSKSYNPHTNIYIANASLPHKQLLQEYFIRFSSTSQHATCPELFTATFQDMRSDNPQQAESCSVVGSAGNKNCRYDRMGGAETERETDAIYATHFSPGIPRTPAWTLVQVTEQYKIACLGGAKAVQDMQTATGVKDHIAEHWITQLLARAREQQHIRILDKNTRDPHLSSRSFSKEVKVVIRNELKCEIQRETLAWLYCQPEASYLRLAPSSPARNTLRPGDHYNPLLKTDGIDPHQDSPVEILHTYLIGNDKYVWHETSKAWAKRQDEEFSVRLSSSSIDALTLPPVRAQYMTQYKNSLIGKHFKALQQLAVFHMHGSLCSDNLLRLWKAAGGLGAILWCPEIRDAAQYASTEFETQNDLQILVDNLLDIWAEFDPRRILYKMKLHTLAHLPDDFRCHGPAVLYSTETFECWNTIFRMCSILSNHLAPSRDIALTLADMERFRHQVSGGWWKDSSGNYVRAGPRVRAYMHTNKQLKRRLGLAEHIQLKHGSFKLVSKPNRRSQTLPNAFPTINIPELEIFPEIPQYQWETETWCRCTYTVSQSSEACYPGSWIFYQAQSTVRCGRILDILIPFTAQTDSQSALVILQSFDVVDCRDERLNMPILLRGNSITVIPPQACRVSCMIIPAQYVAHTDDTCYLVNMHALHNAALIQETLPRTLTAPLQYFHDREAKHAAFAAELRISGPAKRAATTAKAQATRAKNRGHARGGDTNMDRTTDPANAAASRADVAPVDEAGEEPPAS
ncbi:hypothetical protein OF83DRAFT_1088741 [Amylostereum chailletii]|nr:hypothetical protein OF83DRAFT_1088741 [Amylostereum chailletii]